MGEADLATVWLYLEGHGRVGERRHCVRCQPHAKVSIVACSRCGDGPLVVGADLRDGGAAAAAVLAWLAHRGWTSTPELVCTRHTRRQRVDHAAAGPGDILATAPTTPLHDPRSRSRRPAAVGPAAVGPAPYPEHR